MGYLDPGIFGMIAQLGYVLLFGLVSALMFFFQPLKNLANKLFKRDQAAEARPDADEATDPSQRGS